MNCGICKAETEEHFVTYTEDVNQGVVVIRHVPAHVCTECGNVWYSGTVAAHLESIVNTLTSAQHTVGARHAVPLHVNYTETTA